MTLDQLMAFTVAPDHERQEQVWEALKRHYSRQPYEIRRMLTESAVRASDRRAQFVGLDNYVEAGGDILRDLFQPDDGGWLQDAGLLETMVAERLREEADAIRAEGWHWVEVSTDFPYGHTYGMRRIRGETELMGDDEQTSYAYLTAEYERLQDEHADADDLPEEVDARLGEIETAMEALQDRPVRFEPDELAIAGAYVSIDGSGHLRVERGYVRPEDEPVEEADETAVDSDFAGGDEASTDAAEDAIADPDEDEDDGLKPLSDRLVAELTAHRTLALRNALAQEPQVAYLAALHAMVLRLFYRYALDSCVEIDPRSAGFGAQAPGLGETSYALAIDARSETWTKNLPKAPEDLWPALTEWDSDSREALFAHCVAMCVNAVHDPHYRRPRQIAHAGVLASTIGLDMAKAGWTATADSYLGRVTKTRILDAVREAKGDAAADRIAGLKKPEMVTAAEELLDGMGWLPDPLRTTRLADSDDGAEIELVDNTVDDAPAEPKTKDAETTETDSADEPTEPVAAE